MLGKRCPRGWVTVVALLAAASAAGAQAWWNRTWTYRRSVTVGAHQPTRLGGDDIAVVTMPTGGLIKPDGSDIRVATVGLTEVPCRALMVGPGDQVKVAFAVRGAGGRYYVYFGNPNPGKPKESLDIRRGVLLEAWEYPGGGIKTLPQVQQVVSRARRLLGRGFRDRPFLGHNPFGPENRLASRFTAYVICNNAGQYNFSCSSQDASFLLVDDKVVVSNGGHHPPQRDISMRGTVQLTKGLHKLTFYHVNVTGDPIAVVAWQQPGDSRIWPIEAKYFAPIIRAEPGAMEQYGKGMGIDFIPHHEGETFVQNRYYQRWTFESKTVGNIGRNVNLKWDFGDGQVAATPKAEHVYLVPGTYTVSLTAKAYRGDLTRTNRIFVSRPWDEVTSNRLDGVTQQAQIVSEYEFAKLSPEANAEAILLLERARAADAVRQAGLAFLARAKAPGTMVSLVMPMIAETLAPAERVDAYLKASKMTGSASVQAEMAAEAGRTKLRELGDTKGAMEIFQGVIRQYAARTTSPAIRAAKIGIGDVWRFRGDYAEAVKAYRTAGYGERVNVARLEITKGDYARHVEEYLRDGQFADAVKFIEKWESDMPLDKLEGYWSLLVVRMHLKRRQFKEAALEAKTLVKVNPRSNYAARLLLLAAEAFGKLGKDAEAKAALKQIVEKYPESPLAADAAKQLK